MKPLTTSEILAQPTVEEDRTGEAKDTSREIKSLEQATAQLEKAGKGDKAAQIRAHIATLSH